MTLSKFFGRLTSQYVLCKGNTLPDTRKEVNFAKHVIPKIFDSFLFQNSDFQQPLQQDGCLGPKVVSCWFFVIKKYM